MNRPAMSLMDIIAPPGNRWLAEISHRKGTPPPCVRVVRFGSEEDESVVGVDEGLPAAKRGGKSKKVVAAGADA